MRPPAKDFQIGLQLAAEEIEARHEFVSSHLSHVVRHPAVHTSNRWNPWSALKARHETNRSRRFMRSLLAQPSIFLEKNVDEALRDRCYEQTHRSVERMLSA